MTKIISLADSWDRAFDESVKAVIERGILIYPTDTVYGIGGNALDENVVERISRIAKKEKGEFQAIVANLEMLLGHFELDSEEMKYITQLCPGPYTFMLRPKARMPIQNGNGEVGVRIPNNIFARKVCLELNRPMICEPLEGGASEFSMIGKEIIGKADVAIDSGVKLPGKETTVVNIRERKIE
ncbi:MAG: Sua5/YciO/YrdC/YwlC family protein, partial [Candidatus Micrarchaeota archaeon]|nr:Sua5/YciO/YrdC/YwlC family protein [Candidatus Micrarchaeota archaeon]